jgi:thiaminase
MVEHIRHEMDLHIEYCKGFGITKSEMESSEESQGMFKYLMHTKHGWG